MKYVMSTIEKMNLKEQETLLKNLKFYLREHLIEIHLLKRKTQRQVKISRMFLKFNKNQSKNQKKI